VDEPSTQNEKLVGLERKLAKVRNSLKQVNILAFTGMGGIGKTTLAKAVFADVKSTYNASCFIEQLKRKSSHEILCEILQKLGSPDTEAKCNEVVAQNLESLDEETKPHEVDVQQHVQELLASKKVILIYWMIH
jgi:Cdc6-like AAA superfamily ATPase